MDRNALIVSLLPLTLAACAQHRPAAPPAPAAPAERHLANLSRLTAEGDNGEAYWSPDGRRLVWQSNRGGEACDKIWVMDADGGGKRRVSPSHGAHTCSYFLPDGRILYSSTSHLEGGCPPRPEAAGSGKYRYVWSLFPYEIFVAEADGSNPRRLTDNPGYDAEPVASGDGRRIVFGSQREGDFDVYVMDADGANVRRLTDQPGYDGGPWFSPDGTKIAWRAWHPETDEEKALWKDCMARNYIAAVPLDLWVMDADGANKRRILRNGATNWAPSWHPDGRRLVFSSNMDDWREDKKSFGPNFELYLIRDDGTGLERLTYNKVFDSFPMFSPDGKKLAFGSNRDAQNPRQTDIFVADWVE